MEKLMRFENSDIQMVQIGGVWYFDMYSIGMALGQTVIAKGTVYANKARIDKNAKNAEIKPVLRNAKPFITEEQVYDLMLETRTDKCRVFRKWLSNEVLPTLNHEGTYTMKDEPKSDKPYEYFDKTYNGVPVLTTEDICQMTGIHTATIAWYIKNKTEADKDHYRLTGIELRKFKAENPKLKKILKCIYAITRSGFMKFCRAYGIKMEEPKCFEQKEQPKVSAVHRIYDTFCKYYDIKHCRLTEDVAKALDCGKSSLINESCVLHRQDNDQYKIFTDQTAPLIERQFMMAENLGRIMAGQLRENANSDINYDQEARLFGVVVMAMSLFFDN